MRNLKTALFVALAVLALSASVRATEPAVTAITVEKMHCLNCAQSMAEELYAVPGVAKVTADVKAKRMTVSPKAGSQVSPRALWEAVEKAGFKPTRLEGPAGKFTTRPGA